MDYGHSGHWPSPPPEFILVEPESVFFDNPLYDGNLQLGPRLLEDWPIPGASMDRQRRLPPLSGQQLPGTETSPSSCHSPLPNANFHLITWLI